ncbi:putative CC-NBS resistance protein, partial [Trifolium pratense]
VIVVMVVCFPSTPKKLAMSIACSLSGAVILAVGGYLSYVNVEPQRARTMARDKFVLDTLRKKYGYIPPSEVRRMARDDSLKEHK